MRPWSSRGRRVEVILTMAVSEAIENYLETIYILSKQQNEVHAIDVCSYPLLFPPDGLHRPAPDARERAGHRR